ncbi:glycosyltransferase family 4 protein [bacterium]|nr:glycosyltransferase family 4 protein [bacterium]
MRTRILFVHHGSALGGAFLSLLYLLQALDEDRYECTVCSAEKDNDVIKKFTDSGFDTCMCALKRFAHTTLGQFDLLRYSGWRGIGSWFADYGPAMSRFKQTIQDIRPDLVHLNSLTLAPYARVSHDLGVPTVVHVREPVLEGYLGLRKNWLRGLLESHADKVIAICKDNLDRLHIEQGKGVVIYNPVDFGKFDCRHDQRSARKQLGVPEESKVVLFAGGTVPLVKGLHEFLQAMSLVCKHEPDIACLMPSFKVPQLPAERVWNVRRRTAWLLGRYRYSDKLAAMTAKNGLRSRIIGGEFSYEIEKWIAASDVVCVPHIQPHFSRTVMEAGAMAKPVVGFRIAGVEEVVRHEETGLLVDVGDACGLADAVQRLLSDAGLRDRLGQGGLQQAKRLFDATTSAARVGGVYDELLRL